MAVQQRFAISSPLTRRLGTRYNAILARVLRIETGEKVHPECSLCYDQNGSASTCCAESIVPDEWYIRRQREGRV